MTERDCEGERFADLSFTEDTFEDCDFTDCVFVDCSFTKCELDHTTLNECKFEMCIRDRYGAGGAFTENINAAGGAGAAEFAQKAIEIYCK